MRKLKTKLFVRHILLTNSLNEALADYKSMGCGTDDDLLKSVEQFRSEMLKEINKGWPVDRPGDACG